MANALLMQRKKFQHTAARRRLQPPTTRQIPTEWVSTHSRPKAAAKISLYGELNRRSFNTQPPEGGCQDCWEHSYRYLVFQHTAARRRLHGNTKPRTCIVCFNTQPPEGGCLSRKMRRPQELQFQHTAARRRLLLFNIG